MESRNNKFEDQTSELITPENITAHLADIELVLHLAPGRVAALFDDACLAAFKKSLDGEFDDCKNVAATTVRNAVSFYHHDGEETALYFQSMRAGLDAQLDEVVQQLRIKYDELLSAYTRFVVNARSQFRQASGYNDIIFLANLKKDISSGMKHSATPHQPRDVDAFVGYNLDRFQKEVAEIVKSAKHGKKQLVHDVGKYLEAMDDLRGQDHKKHHALLFNDKHSISFTPRAYAIESRAAVLASAAKQSLVSLKSEAESRIRNFGKEVFMQNHFERIRKSASQVAYGLQSFKDIYSHKNRIATILKQDIKEVSALISSLKDKEADASSQCLAILDGLNKLDRDLLAHFDSALTLDGMANPVMQRLQDIELQRNILREQLNQVEEAVRNRRAALNRAQCLPVAKQSSTSMIRKQLKMMGQGVVPEIRLNGEKLDDQRAIKLANEGVAPSAQIEIRSDTMRYSI